SKKALAITTDCTPRYCYADPVEGGKQAVAEAYRNLCAVGAKPLAITNCLNFGNPQRPEIMGQFVGCVEGMAEACRALDFPVVSGNVSLYNETKNEDGSSVAIMPTPAIGGVGLLDNWEKSATIAFKAEGDQIYLIAGKSFGRDVGELGQSLWLREVKNRQAGSPPFVDLELERRNGEFVRKLISEDVATAVHDVSDGGLLVALTEMALAGDIGFEAQTFGNATKDAFSEDQARYLVTVRVGDRSIEELAAQEGVACDWIGVTRGKRIALREERDYLVDEVAQEGVDKTPRWAIPLTELRAAHEGFFPRLMGSELTPEF
ncbi:MAG: AIR synthase related protein, partial [Sphingomicrobium sp.]